MYFFNIESFCVYSVFDLFFERKLKWFFFIFLLEVWVCFKVFFFINLLLIILF